MCLPQPGRDSEPGRRQAGLDAERPELRALCDRHGIPIMLDATRAVENAYFIQQREPGYAGKKIAEILREFCSYTDGCTMSGRKTRW